MGAFTSVYDNDDDNDDDDSKNYFATAQRRILSFRRATRPKIEMS